MVALTMTATQRTKKTMMIARMPGSTPLPAALYACTSSMML